MECFLEGTNPCRVVNDRTLFTYHDDAIIPLPNQIGKRTIIYGCLLSVSLYTSKMSESYLQTNA